MIRTQIQLTKAQYRRLRMAAAEEGVSLSEMIRRTVDSALGERTPSRAELYTRAAGIVGSFQDREGAEDLSGQHDDYLQEAFR
jgi:hypothetical protein